MSQLAGQPATGAHSAALNSDPSIASSALQKAIRRGDQAVAFRAAAILSDANSDKLWRRLVVIAMEDIGIGDLDLVSEVLTLSGRRAWRAQNGGEQHFVRDTIQRLCSAPKSRDACDVLVVADLMPSLASARAEMFDLDDVALTQMLSKDGPLEDCVLAAWYLAGTDRFPAYSLAPRAGNFTALMDRLSELGAPSQAITAATLGSTRTREGFRIALPGETGCHPDCLAPGTDREQGTWMLRRDAVAPDGLQTPAPT